MILNGQCLKLADNTAKTINANIENIIDATENNPIMSDSLSNLVKESNNILLIVSPDINIEIYDYIVDICNGKNIAIISDNIPEKYKQYQTTLNQSPVEDYIFFGACAGRAPMLIHKNMYNYDLVITVSSVIMNAYGGFLGSITTLFNAITAPKTIATVIKYALQDSIYKYNVHKLSSGLTIRNPVYESIREGIITASKAVHSFSINIAVDYKNIENNNTSIFAGDTFLSQIEAQNIIMEKHNSQTPPHLFDGIKVSMKCYNNVVYFISLIEDACKKLNKGGRLLIEISDINSFGNEIFKEIFYNNTLTEIADNVNEDNYMESFYAFILKYYTQNYHIALPANEKLNNALIQAGLNPLNDEELNKFLDSCTNKGSI